MEEKVREKLIEILQRHNPGLLYDEAKSIANNVMRYYGYFKQAIEEAQEI